MALPELQKITVDTIAHPLLKENKIMFDVLRLDKIHPVISGNKWFKLKYHLEEFKKGNYNGILTFGGAWSNHIVAAACTASLENIPSVGIIRGEEPNKLSHTLKSAADYGMKLEFISRDVYRNKEDENLLNEFGKKYPDHYIIPEGGAGENGIKGCEEMMQLVNKSMYTHIAVAFGTGTMSRGIARSSLPNQQIIIIPVLKGMNHLQFKENKMMATERSANAKFYYNYHFGGYAKHSPSLIAFMNDFYAVTGIPTDFVYTGKLVYAIFDLIKKEEFPQQSRILMIHSGGLQGNQSLPQGTLIF